MNLLLENRKTECAAHSQRQHVSIRRRSGWFCLKWVTAREVLVFCSFFWWLKLKLGLKPQVRLFHLVQSNVSDPETEPLTCFPSDVELGGFRDSWSQKSSVFSGRSRNSLLLLLFYLVFTLLALKNTGPSGKSWHHVVWKSNTHISSQSLPSSPYLSLSRSLISCFL